MKSQQQFTSGNGPRRSNPKSWIFALLVAAAALFPSFASAGPVVVVRPLHRHVIVRPVTRPVVVRTVAPRPLHRVWVAGHWTHTFGGPLWVPGHFLYVR